MMDERDKSLVVSHVQPFLYEQPHLLVSDVDENGDILSSMSFFLIPINITI